MQARQLPPRTGIAWLQASYLLYRRNPPLLTSVTMLYLLIVIGLNFVPILGSFIVPLLLPILNLIVANTCRVIEKRELPSNAGLFFGVREQRPELLKLGGLQLAGSVVVLLLSVLLEGGMIPLPNPEKPDLEGFAGMLLRLFIMAVPFLMAFWFAPLLTGWHKIPAGKAVFFSLVSCWRNWRVFIVYGLATALIAIVIPGLLIVLTMLALPGFAEGLSFVLRLLLIMVFTPMLMASAYISYQDIFQSPTAAEPEVENA
ncbi:MAG TPA: BPSS1780 family membrane protein [Rhodocyclaceae bacterium]|jgi:hypothetical protein|nr:BPSS1780 family membrane protein [Rhodocyclaceae bacterium]